MTAARWGLRESTASVGAQTGLPVHPGSWGKGLQKRSLEPGFEQGPSRQRPGAGGSPGHAGSSGIWLVRPQATPLTIWALVFSPTKEKAVLGGDCWHSGDGPRFPKDQRAPPSHFTDTN